MNNNRIIALFGGSGFIGKILMRELTKLDYRVKVPSRKPYLHGNLKPLGNPGQIVLVALFQSGLKPRTVTSLGIRELNKRLCQYVA